MRVESLHSLRIYQDCPQAYDYRYRQKIEVPIKSSHFRMGSFVDFHLSTALERGSISFEENMPLEHSKTLWEDTPDCADADWETSKQIATRVLRFIRDLKWTTCYTQDLWPDVPSNRPCVQMDIHAEGIHGIIDWLAYDQNKNLCVVDFKVSKTQPDPFATLDYDRQLGFYAWLLRKNTIHQPIRLYQLQILGCVPRAPRLVKHAKSTQKNPRFRPETGKILTTWEIWEAAALKCGVNPDLDEYKEHRKYLENITWQCLVHCYCPEEVQDRISENERLIMERIQTCPPTRNIRNFKGGPCNPCSPISKRCQVFDVCMSDLAGIPRSSGVPISGELYDNE